VTTEGVRYPTGWPGCGRIALGDFRSVADLSRRRVLASGASCLAAVGLAGLGGLAGCTGRRGGGLSTPATPTPTPPPPDPLLAELADERRLLAAYDAVGRGHPALAARIAPPRADHAAHEAALAQAVDENGNSAAPTGSPSRAIPLPAAPAAVLARLRAAERAASAARSAAALTAPGQRSGLLASIAASEATHELILR
jgi:hypothetical protein